MRLLSLVAAVALAAPLSGQVQQTSSPEGLLQQPALRRELLDMFAADQAARIQAMRLFDGPEGPLSKTVSLSDPRTLLTIAVEGFKVTVLDLRNRTRLKEITDEHGWPGRALVGEDGAMAAWLVAQHSDLDVAFQKRCLELMQRAPDGDVEAQHIAYLTDRVLVAEGKKQRFGTQMDNKFEPRPIEDPENVDQRRADVGLPPLAEYLRTAKEVYKKMASGAADSTKSDK